MRGLLVLSATALGACAMTPAEVREAADRTVHQVRRPPALAAGCIARNFENRTDAFRATVRPLGDGNTYEVVLRAADGVNALGAIGLVEIAPSGSGSDATVFRHPGRFSDRAFDGLTDGC